MEALHKHVSQYAWMKTFAEDDLYEACRVLARFRGLQRGCKYAEGFVGHQSLRLLRRLPPAAIAK